MKSSALIVLAKSIPERTAKMSLAGTKLA